MDFSSTSHPATAAPTATAQSSGDAPIRENPRNRADNSDAESLPELMKVVSTFVGSFKDRTAMLCCRMEHEADASAKRKTVNAELLKLPSLSREGRLRAATLIVKDISKLDLFHSLGNNDKSAWIQMLLDGKLD